MAKKPVKKYEESIIKRPGAGSWILGVIGFLIVAAIPLVVVYFAWFYGG